MNTVLNTMGIEATNFEETLKASNLDWEPLADEVAGLDTGIEMPHKKLLYRSDTRAALGVVGSDYEPSQPREFLQTQFDFAQFVQGKVVRAGFIPDRSRAFAFVDYTTIDIPKKLRKVGDPMKVYIYSTDGWDGGTPRRSRLYVERLKCLNGMMSTQLAASLWVSHTKSMASRYELRWKKFLAEIRKHVDLIREQFVTLAQNPMTAEEMKGFLTRLMPGETNRTKNRRSEVLNLFSNGVGNLGRSRWDAYNAVTEYVTHHRSYRGTDTTSEETNRFLGVMETDTLRVAALNLLLN